VIIKTDGRKTVIDKIIIYRHPHKIADGKKAEGRSQKVPFPLRVRPDWSTM
jgi:hypothetical protein